MPIARFQMPDGRIARFEIPAGLSPEQAEQLIQAEVAGMGAPKAAPTSIRDVALSVGQGALGGIQALTDVFGAGNVVSQALERGQRAATEAMTPERQAELQRAQQRAKAAEGKGTMAEVSAALEGIKEAPLQGTAQAVGSFLPYMLTGLAAAPLRLLPATVRAVNMAISAAQGVGAVKGSIYDAVKERLVAEGMSPETAEQQAQAAQAYVGKNAEQLLLGGGLGALAGRFGAESLLSKAGAQGAAPGLLRRAGTAAVGEAIPEGAQGAQERLAANLALQREGVNVPTFQGVAGQATTEALLGALGGGAVAAVRGPEIQPPPAPPAPPQPPAPPAPPEIDLSRPAQELILQREALRAEEQTPAVKEAIKQLDAQIKTLNVADVEAARARKAQEQADAEKAARSAFTQPGQQMEMREFLPPGGAQLATEMETEPTLRQQREEYRQGRRDLREQGQMRLPFRYTAEGEPTSITPPPPPRIYMTDIEAVGVPFKTARDWFNRNVVNRTRDEVAALVEQDPSLVQGRGARAKILRTLLGPEVPAFKEPPRAKPTPVSGPTEPGGDQRGVGVSGALPDTGPAAAPAVSEPERPVPAGLERVEPPAPAGVAGEGQQALELTTDETPPAASTPGAPAAAAPAEGPTGAPVETAAPAAAPAAQEPPAAPPAAPVEDTRTAAEVQAEMDSLRNQQQGLLTSKGKIPAPKSKARTAYDALEAQIQALRPIYDQKAEAERQRDAADMQRRMEEQQKKTAAPVRPALPAAAPAPAKPTPPISEEMREPIGTSTFGMEEGQVEIRRGPQAELFPSSKAETRKRAEAADERERAAAEEPAAEAPAADERQLELDFTAKEEPVEAVATPAPSDMEMLRAIDGKPMIEVAEWASRNLPDPDQKVIARRVAEQLRQLQALGATLSPIKVTAENRRLASGAKGVTLYERVVNKPSVISITLNHPANGDQSGVTPEILLHELLHGATLGSIYMGLRKSAAGTRVGNATRELLALTDAVIEHFNARVQSGAELTPFERAVYERRNNALLDQDEVLAWGLTNRTMQQYLESIPYKGSNAWNKFVTFIRDLLGIPAKADTALSELLRVSDTLLDLKIADIKGAETAIGRQFAKSYSTNELVDLMGRLAPADEKAAKQLVDATAQSMEPNWITRFRTQAVDYAATLESRLTKEFDGAVRNSLGKLNPFGLYRQAQDYTKMLLEYFQTGTLVKDPNTGLYRAERTADIPPPAEVFALRDAWVKKNDLPLEQGRKLASRILEGKRLQELLKANPDFPHAWSAADIADAVRQYDADPDLQALSAAMDKPRIALVDHMVRVGRLSPEKGAEWKSVVGYVPFDREQIENFMEKFTRTKRLAGKSPLMLTKDPELVGSFKRPVGDVFENYINTMGWMIGQIMSNDARVQTLRSLEDIGVTGKPKRLIPPDAKGRTATAFVDGEKMYWVLPSAYDALAFMDVNPPKAGWLKALSSFSDVLRRAVTSLPPFALKQVTDDVQRAIMTSGVQNVGGLIYSTLTNFPKLAVAEIRGIQHPMVREFGALGLTGEYDFQSGKPAESLLKDMGLKKRSRFETLMHRLDGITRASDLAVRKAIYDHTLRETNDALLAQTRAREFINFRRRGANDFVGVMVSTIPFFNAYAQGMDVLYRAATGQTAGSSVERAQALKMFWSRAAMLTAMATLYAMGKSDDEDYQEMDLRTRDNNWILPGGYKLPVPGEFAAVFKVIPERVVEYYRRSGTPEEQEAWEATRTALTYMAEQYVGRMVPIPQAAKPLLEAWTNFSFLTGRPLEGIFQKQIDPSQRRAIDTSELAIAIANFTRDTFKTEISPILIDNTLRGYLGSTAAMVTMVTDGMLNPDRTDRPLHKWALLSNYLYDPVGTRRIGEFYEMREKVGLAKQTLAELARTDLAAAEAYAEKNSDILSLTSTVNDTIEQLERTRAYRKFLNSPEGAKDMSVEERTKELEEIRKYEVELANWVREAKTEINRAAGKARI